MNAEEPLYKPNGDERILAILSHILAIVPGIGILGPLVIYLSKKDESPFVAANARESLNFQITIILGYIVWFILIVVLIGFFMLAVWGILNTVLVIVATIKASEEKVYRYPFSLRLV
jgi:uncharacterized Tic20 family protein